MNEIVESSGSKMEERKTPFKVSFDDVTEDIVKVQMNSNFGKTFVFEFSECKNEIRIGRMNECDLHLPDMHVSKVQCTITYSTSGTFLLKDSSINGTYVNGDLVGKGNTFALKDNDNITVCKGKFVFIFKPMTNVFAIDGVNEIYEVQDILGHGASAVVRRVVDRKSGQVYAMKIIKKRLQTKKKFIKREVEILQKIDHPNVIKYANIIDGRKHLYIVLEYVSGGDLFDRITKGRLSERTACLYFTQILKAVQYLHSLGIAHRDMKPENILLTTNKEIKVTDFGLANFAKDNAKMMTVCGTPHYLAPEIVRFASKDTVTGYSSAVDMWSLGVILYLMLSSQLPFSEDLVRNMSLYELIETATYEFDPENWDHISHNAKDLIKNLLVVDPKLRYSADKALNHPWIAEHVTVKKRKYCTKDVEISKHEAKEEEPKKRKTQFIEKKMNDMDINKENLQVPSNPQRRTSPRLQNKIPLSSVQ